MKNLFCILCLLMFSSSTFAAEVVSLSVNSLPLQTEMLKDKYSAYEITFQNSGNNPVKIENIHIDNIVNNSNQVLVSEGLQGIKKNNKYTYLCFLTFGITGFIGMAKNSVVLNEQKAALAEAATYSTNYNLECMKSEIIMTSRTKTIRILTPINEEPKIQALFKDVNSNKYFEVVK